MLDQLSASAMAAVFLTTAAPLIAQGPSQFRNWTPASLGESRPIKPRGTCGSLVALTGYELSITSAIVVPASGDVPEFCRVSGLVQPEVRFEVNLPSVWNGRLYMIGNGGYAGESLTAPGRVAILRRALARGFATAQTNTGHDSAVEPLGTFAASPQKFLDYAYRAVHVTALTAKRLLQFYYDGPLRHSYFEGCSTGGRQGLISAQRFPEDFDGIVVGAPVLDFSGTMIGFQRYQRALAAAPISIDHVKIVAETVYDKCDALDGLKDGLIDDPRRCAFTPSADLPRCAGDSGSATCFTAAQLQALDTIYSSVKRNGVELVPSWPVGSEIGTPSTPNGPSSSGWIPWFIDVSGAPPIQRTFGETFFKYLAFGKPNPSYDWTTFNVDADADKLEATHLALDATDPDLSRFQGRGGRILGYFGWADPALNPLIAINYYETVVRRLGPSTRGFYRMFMVPGMFHCGSGVGVNTLDAITPLVEWVEKGTAPASIVGSRIVDGKVVRTRPLCAYPEAAIYKGSGSIDEASSFTCARPKDVRRD